MELRRRAGAARPAWSPRAALAGCSAGGDESLRPLRPAPQGAARVPVVPAVVPTRFGSAASSVDRGGRRR